MFFNINYHSMHVERTSTPEVQPDALQQTQISSRGGCVSPGHFSPLVLKLPFFPSSPPAIGSLSDSEGGHCPHLSLCLLMTPFLSTQPPSPATLLAFQRLFLKLLGPGWQPDNSPRPAVYRAVPRGDIWLPRCGQLAVLCPGVKPHRVISLHQLS